MSMNYTLDHKARSGFIRLDMNENNWGPSQKILDAIHDLKLEDLCMYPEKCSLINAIADKYEIGTENILLGNGSDELIDLIGRSFVTDDTHIILPIPTFSMFEICFGNTSSRIEKIKYEDDLSYPTDRVIGSIQKQTGIIVAVSPNNPTGTTLPREQLIRILESAPYALVIVDEAYADFDGETYIALVKSYSNLIVLRTFSKSYGLAGLRIGYAVSSTKIIDRMRSYQMPFSVNTVAMKAAVVAIKTNSILCEMRQKLLEKKTFIISELQRLNIPTRNTEANFILADTGLWTDELYRSLKKSGILVRNLKEYPMMESFLRITIGTPEENKVLIDTVRYLTSRRMIIFDMDGVLVDTRKSYDTAIKETVEYFTDNIISDEDIWKLRNKGNYNNDWLLTQDLIHIFGKQISFDMVKDEFQKRFLGDDFDGLISQEKWCADLELLEKLSTVYTLAIFTGRPRSEALFTLKKNNALTYFSLIITCDDLTENEQKPSPKGIQRLMSEQSAEMALYVGDTVDDINAALSAGITPILCTSNEDVEKQVRTSGCRFVFRRVNDIMEKLL